MWHYNNGQFWGMHFFWWIFWDTYGSLDLLNPL
jgi:hypothetical protein